uniref:Protein OSCP1 n=1 Tax=Parastrongyloides trichosuri TaxID=131310 RepID=A0A0N4ZEJ3_PARTI
MALNIMPIMVINMTGEMLYVLEQRLKCYFYKAQSQEEEKSSKVLCDIIGALTNKEFMEQLFKPQELYDKTTMRHFFETLVHSSIMRLNISSMDKLYALMTMAFKYQIMKCVDGQQIVLVTLNHLDEMMALVRNNSVIKVQLEEVYDRVLISYKNLRSWEYYLIRNSLLNYFNDFKIRIALLLKMEKQNDDGSFIIFKNDEVVSLPSDGNCPGSVKYYEKNVVKKVVNFEVPYSYEPSLSEGCYNKNSNNRGTCLGLNMYRETGDVLRSLGPNKVIPSSFSKKVVKNLPPEGDEMKLLNALIINRRKDDEELVNNFHLKIFDDDDNDDGNKQEKKKNSTDENVKKSSVNSKKSLSTAMDELNMEIKKEKGEKKYEKGKDLLAMMDEAVTTTKIKSRSNSNKRTSHEKEEAKSRSSSAKRIVPK